MKLAIIGAGAAGLVSLKYGLDEGHECDVYEQTGEIGGVWVYREEIEDEHGRPIMSPMYHDLSTNLPKEVMTFLDFPYPTQNKSFIPRSQVLDYFLKFVIHFSLLNHIKFFSRVTQVALIDNERWNITAQNIKTGKEESKEYDAVFVCSGHYNSPNLAKIPGQDVFKGQQLHSVFFRKPEKYKNKRVLIVGGGPSAIDIARLISQVSQHVYSSHHGKYLYEPAASVIRKPAISHLDEDEVVFEDGTRERIEVVIYGTGYNYMYPFLKDDCGIQVEKKWVSPLFKHVVNIEHPTMFFIGIPHGLFIIPMFDLQARFALASLKKRFRLPAKEVMMNELNKYIEDLKKRNLSVQAAHQIFGEELQLSYFQELAITAGIRPIPPVISNIYSEVRNELKFNRCYTIIDDENYTVTEC